jgi:2-dehydro-3-deoxyphosphogluconate aldolase / (4S)-4-hydroxy-2-oxoglutarate aldolase
MAFRRTELPVSPRSDPLAAIAAMVVLPVVREQDSASALTVAGWLVEQGLEAVELTASTPGWEDAVRELRDAAPELALGVGTLRTREDAERALALGADFLVTPCPAPEVRAVATVPMVEGGFTPGEVLAAADRGMAKLFPAHVGGPALLRSILALSPQARIVPTGGIGLADVPTWIDAGAVAVGIGSELRPGADAAAALREVRGR